MRTYSNNEPRSFTYYGVTPAKTASQNKTALQEAAGNLAAAGSGSKVITNTGEQVRIGPGVKLAGVRLKADRRTHFKGSPTGARFIIEDNSASIFEFGNGAAIEGFDFDFPLNNLATTTPENLTVYPDTIILDPLVNTPQSLSVIDCGFIGGSGFINFSQSLNQDIKINDLYGYPLHRSMVKIDQCNDIPYLHTIHVNPGAGIFYRPGQANTGTPCSQAVIEFVISQGGATIDIDRADEFRCRDLFAYGVKTAYKVRRSYGSFFQCDADIVETMFDIETGEDRKGVQIMGCSGLPSGGATPSARNAIKFGGIGGMLYVTGLNLHLGTASQVPSSSNRRANAAILVNGTGTQRLALNMVKCHSPVSQDGNGAFSHDIQRVNGGAVVEHSMFNIANATNKHFSPLPT